MYTSYGEPYPTVNGHQCVLAVTDHLTCFALAMQFAQKTAEAVTTACILTVVCIFYTPVTLLSDILTKFCSSLLHNIAPIVGSMHKFC